MESPITGKFALGTPASLLHGGLDSRMIARLAHAKIEQKDMQYRGLQLQPEQVEELHAAHKAINSVDPGAAWEIYRAFERDPQRLLDAAQGQTASTVAAVIAVREARVPDNEQYQVPLPERDRDWGL